MASSILRFAAFFVFSLAVLPSAIQAQVQGEADREEYGVYEAVLNLMDHIPREEPHVTIFDLTLNGKCGETKNPGPLASGCSFLWIKPADERTVQRLLRTEWPDMDPSTWKDFAGRAEASVRLHDPISTPWKHKLIGPGDDESKDWDSPDMTIFLSRVGFNEKKTEALVYVLTFSYMDEVRSGGDYFRFRKSKGKTGGWEVIGRLNYFQTKGQED